MAKPAAPQKSVSARSAQRYIALLRGINVGGKHSLPMKDLAALFDAAGCNDVQTYIQSGNVVFGASPRVVATLPRTIAGLIQDQFGFSAPVIVRSAAELRAVTAGNPYVKAGVDPKELHLMFLAAAPAAAQTKKLDPKRSPPDSYVVSGADVYLRMPNGVGRSKLTNAYFDATLGTTSTLRNWRTVLELLARADG